MSTDQENIQAQATPEPQANTENQAAAAEAKP